MEATAFKRLSWDQQRQREWALLDEAVLSGTLHLRRESSTLWRRTIEHALIRQGTTLTEESREHRPHAPSNCCWRIVLSVRAWNAVVS